MARSHPWSPRLTVSGNSTPRTPFIPISKAITMYSCSSHYSHAQVAQPPVLLKTGNWLNLNISATTFIYVCFDIQ